MSRKKANHADLDDALGIAAQAAYAVMTDLDHPPAALMLVVMTANGETRIADGGSSAGQMALLLDAPAAVARYAHLVRVARKQEAH